MRFEVPQFIEIEDKVVGALTWRQFVYIAGGVGILVLLYIALPIIFFILFGIPLAVLSFSLAFHRVNNRPFSIFLESVVSFFTHKKLYLWKKDQVQTITEVSSRTPRQSHGLADVNQKSINSLSHKLEHQIPE